MLKENEEEKMNMLMDIVFVYHHDNDEDSVILSHAYSIANKLTCFLCNLRDNKVVADDVVELAKSARRFFASF